MNIKQLTTNFFLPFSLLILVIFTTSMINKRHYVPETHLLAFGKDTDGDGVKDKKDKCPGTPQGVQVDETGCPLDNDKDGVADYIDKCPAEIGTPALEGCPDKDNDGVADKDDACPGVPGIGRFRGCPDSDDDGIEDTKDHCPNSKGLDIFNGCPDTDGDGVQDEFDKCVDTRKGVKVDTRGCPSDIDGDGIFDSDDKCPTTKGMGTTTGCPEIKLDVKKRLQFAAKGINFETGEARLKITSFAMLDEVYSILKEYPDYILKIGGHTDDVGDDNANLKLSQDRVNAVRDYLVTKGIKPDRIQAVGYGESKPIESNKNETGRMQNRRVELELAEHN